MNLRKQWEDRLKTLREQGMSITDINPVSALAEMVDDDIYEERVSRKDIEIVLDNISEELWRNKASSLRYQAGLDGVKDNQFSIAGLDITQPLYRAVFTAHPTFALKKDVSQAVVYDAVTEEISKPLDAFSSRESISLQEEHLEAMAALRNGRTAVNLINESIINQNTKSNPESWQDEIPNVLGVATWVGYDLDGRTDISWIDSFSFRLYEKIESLKNYKDAMEKISHPEVSKIKLKIEKELIRNEKIFSKFKSLKKNKNDFNEVMNLITDGDERLLSSKKLANQLHYIAKQNVSLKEKIEIMVLVADLYTHGFGMGEIHLRINAAQIRNAMRPVDGRALSISDGENSARLLVERLALRIKNESSWSTNFKNLDQETALARRQMMLARQIIKHIDSDQQVKLLIAECERPLTIMSALYLAHKFGIADSLDISPLFETSYGLEHGEKLIDQLLQQEVFVDYLRKRKILTIQTGFSDAGRFIGQIAANMAIERLQTKIINCLKNRMGKAVDLLVFNTHGESFGRGGIQSNMNDRQSYIMTPFVRNHAKENGIRLYHQSSFQGGDGYRLFGSFEVAVSTLKNIFIAEINLASQVDKTDAFYQQTDFSLDLFSGLKDWHEKLLNDPSYSDLVDIFDNNLLPVTGSRPTRRVVGAGNERRGPSKIRAITHNAILQQLGYLANVVSGMGCAATLDTDEFVDIFSKSSRLRQCLNYVLRAKEMGSLNTVLAYSRLLDPGFWVNKAYHGKQEKNQRGLRSISQLLRKGSNYQSIQKTVWNLRDDLVDLYRLVEKLGLKSVRPKGDDRLQLDLLHSIRIALVSNSLMLVCSLPRLGETNRHSNDDILNYALKLDFDSVSDIIRTAFRLESTVSDTELLSEKESYSIENIGSFIFVDKQVLAPLEQNKIMIKQITQMISAVYGAHG